MTPNVRRPERTGAVTEKVRALRGLVRDSRRTLALVASVDRRRLTAWVLCQLVDALTLVAIVWVGKHLVDAIVAVLAHQQPHASALRWVAVEFGIVGIRAVVSAFDQLLQIQLRTAVESHVNVLVLEKAARISFAQFESPEFVDALTRARNDASHRPFDLVAQSVAVVRHCITLAGFAILLASLGVWAILVLVAAAVPPFIMQAVHGRAAFALKRSRTAVMRRASYLAELGTADATVKEIRALGLARWLIDGYADAARSVRDEETKLARGRARAMMILSVVSAAMLYATYAWVVQRTVVGGITLGSMTLYIIALRQGQSTLQSALSAIARAYESQLSMTNLFEFFAFDEGEPDGAEAFVDHGALRAPRLELRDVTFRYPGGSRDALANVDLDLAAGETVAVVGRNGAGKTTLVKLLIGLHEPTSGVVCIDGDDIAGLTRAELRRRVGVVFQDFARFQLRVRDNVGVGWVPSLDDEPGILSALRDAGGETVVDRLPEGPTTQLGRAFGGEELSVGEWQRVALARAFFRRSRLLVLDEPTASMDAASERDLFTRFQELKRDRTAILITHRLATARLADRIVVFEEGRIVERGTHDELIRANGRYAELFKLQAEAYS